MGRIVKYKLPCLNPECGSSDARNLYEDGSSSCFSCKKYFPAEQTKAAMEDEDEAPPPKKKKLHVSGDLTAEDILKCPTKALGRGIGVEVCEHYGVKVGFNSDGEICEHYYPYQNNEAFKVRKIPKAFYSVGKCKSLFGRDKFASGGKRVIVTEGEVDTLSIAQAYYDKYKRVYPVVSLPSASGTSMLLQERDWLRSFKEVVLWLDNDSAGKDALDRAIKIVGVDKARIVRHSLKDANKVLTELGGQDVLNAIYDAEKYVPAGIIGKEALWEALIKYNNTPSVAYPECLDGVNHKIKGMREGEIALFISGTGSGKSTIMREVMLHILRTTKDTIGIVSLEEAPAETARKLSGMAINKNPALQEITPEELKPGFDEVFGEDRVILLDHQGSIKDDSIIEKLEYMCLAGCKYLFIDHITILVSEGADGLTGNEAIDKVMNDMLRLVKSHPVWIGLVSHLRKVSTGGKSFEEGKIPSMDDIKGSGSIKQICFDIIAFARNMAAVDEGVRNQIKMCVLKSRTVGQTGPVPGARYIKETGRLVGLGDYADDGFESD
jgi:twinkle protein